MTINNMTFRIGGAAGDGVESSGAGFCQALGRGGLHVFGLPDYYSRIRGGHNFFSIRVSDQPLYCHQESVHLLLALTEETIPRHRDKMVEGGVVVYDSGQVQDLNLGGQVQDLNLGGQVQDLNLGGQVQDLDPGGQVQDLPLRGGGVQFLPIPMSEMAKEKAGTELARNTLALGVAAGLSGFDLGPMEGVIRQNFARKGQKVVDGNLAAVEAGYQEGRKYAADFPFKVESRPDAPPRMVLNGTEAFSLGALAGGCRFVAGYPMTPGSPVLHWFAAHAAEYGAVIKHAEDEIAAINMAIGAAHMGARAMVPTSGGGFSLMVEATGMAGITETPVVIYNAQRPGPATGLPTRQEQGDLLFMLHASQGEFPRFLLAPGTHEECFVAGWRAFNLADKCQTPALVLSDHYLAVAVRTLDLDAFDFEAVEIERGELLTKEELDGLEEPYLRFRVTDPSTGLRTSSGVSPRAVPGHPNAVWVSTANEHDERGAVNEEADNRVAQVEKRMRKMEGMVQEVGGLSWYGPEEAELTFICWGSTYGALREAVERLNAERPPSVPPMGGEVGERTAGGGEEKGGIDPSTLRRGSGRALLRTGRANMLCFNALHPFPLEAVEAALERAKRTIVVEGNATGQLEMLLRARTGRSVDGAIRKYDGRAFTSEYILAHVSEEV